MATTPVPIIGHGMAGVAWRIWAEYWIRHAQTVPPLAVIGGTLSGGALLAVAIRPSMVRDFCEAEKANVEALFLPQGETVFDEMRWLGAWSAFSADRR